MRIVYPGSGIDVDCFSYSVPDSAISPFVGVSQDNDILATLAQKIVKVTDWSLQQTVGITWAKLFVKENVKHAILCKPVKWNYRIDVKIKA